VIIALTLDIKYTLLYHFSIW